MEIAKYVDDVGGTHFFVSLDGKYFLEVTRKPDKDDESVIKKLFKGSKNSRPIQLYRSYLLRMAAYPPKGELTFETL